MVDHANPYAIPVALEPGLMPEGLVMHRYAGEVLVDATLVDCRLGPGGELPASSVAFAERLGEVHAAGACEGIVVYVYDGDTGEAHLRLGAGEAVCYSSMGARMAISASAGTGAALTFVGEALDDPPPTLAHAMAMLLLGVPQDEPR